MRWTITQSTVTVNTVTVEADELTDPLLTVLRSAAGAPGLVYARAPERMSGGFWADLFAFSLADPPNAWPRELVVRLMPDATFARRETIIQRAVAASGFPTPAVRAAGGPDDGLGFAFMVMDRAPGAMLLSGLSAARALGRGSALFREIPRLLAATMAQLHALDPEPVRDQLDAVGAATPSVSSMLARLGEFADGFRRPDLVQTVQWFVDHPAHTARDVICHGDLHPFNLLRDGSRVTLLDWTTALLAPRLYDVAFTSLVLSEALVAGPGWLRPLVRLAGRRAAIRFVRSYQRSAGVAIDEAELAWYQAVVCLRALVEVAGWTHFAQTPAHAGHPWLSAGPAFAARLTAMTGVAVTGAG
jgi:aminoglycoside phosphotransferase (APT) family kinase protein